MGKYIKKFESIWKSTNPVYYVSKDTLEDIMTYITDEFEVGKIEIRNSTIAIIGSMIKKVVIIDCLLNVPKEKNELYDNLLKMVTNRIINMTGRTIGVKSNEWKYMTIGYNKSLEIIIDDSRLE